MSNRTGARPRGTKVYAGGTTAPLITTDAHRGFLLREARNDKCAVRGCPRSQTFDASTNAYETCMVVSTLDVPIPGAFPGSTSETDELCADAP